MASSPKKVVLAYSGGLDTSVIAKWLQTQRGCEVVAFTADLGQGGEIEKARTAANKAGVKEIHVEDLREEFVRDYVFPMLRAMAVYEGVYLLGTAIARPLIAKCQIALAQKVGAEAVSHGATGKGNDQVRFELGYQALDPHMEIIAPWREWHFTSRADLIQFAHAHQIPVAADKEGEPPFSMDANILHTSCEGKCLEDPALPPPDFVFQRTLSPQEAPNTPLEVSLDFEKGDAVGIDGQSLPPHTRLARLNEMGGAHGVGRVDMVENRQVGMKSRGVYETPGGTILFVARRALESLTLDAGATHLKEDLAPRYASLIYDGWWFSPEREMLQALMDASQEYVSGRIKVRLYKGTCEVMSRTSPFSLYSPAHATFEDDQGTYDQKDAQGFIRLVSLRKS